MWGYRRHTPSVNFLTYRTALIFLVTGRAFDFRAEPEESPEASHPTISGLVLATCATAHTHPSLLEREPPNSTAGVRLSVVCILIVSCYLAAICRLRQVFL